MKAVLLPNGDLLVPCRAESEDGSVLGDGMVVLHPGEPGYDGWLREAEKEEEP